MDESEPDMNKKTATWVTAAVLASLASPILAKTPGNQSEAATAVSVPGPVPGYAMSEQYARLVARQTYFWAWPMVNVYNRLLAMKQVPQPGLNGGIVPVAPPNHLSMLHDYIEPQERFVACPNQDVVYGSAIFDLNQTPVVVQVPDFGGRFWVYQAVDMRTDGFASLGKLYGTKPGFYLFAGPNWHGQVPKGIRQVFRSSTNVGSFIPRVFMDDTPEDRLAVQSVISKVGLYPLSEFDGKVKVTDWAKLPSFRSGESNAEEIKWVDPSKFWDELPTVLDQTPPQHGEEAIYAQARALILAAQSDPALKTAIVDEATKTDADVVTPLFNFNTFGKQLPAHWNTVSNGAAFGTDYFTRTAVAKSNIFVNKPRARYAENIADRFHWSSPGSKGERAIQFFERPYSTASFRISASCVFLPSRRCSSLISFIAVANCEAGTTASPAFTAARLPSSYCLRHANTWFGLTPCRRATAETVAPGSRVSCTMATFSWTERRRRRSGSVRTSMLSTICLGLKLVTRFPLILRGVSCPENQGATPLAPEFERMIRYAFAARFLQCFCCQISPHYSMWWGLLWQLLVRPSRRYGGLAYESTIATYRFKVLESLKVKLVLR